MWLYEEKEFTEIPPNIIGFVYLITNMLTGKKYVGKKLFSKAAYRQVKGKRKKLRKESDWAEYYGSSYDLQSDVVMFGKENFSREILHLCTTKGQCSYFEVREQCDRRVLEFPDKYYNRQIYCRINQKHLKLKIGV